MEKKKYHNIEFLRILFAIIIVYYHILHSNILAYVKENELYFFLAESCDAAGIIVECFFIISGYFLFYSYLNKPSVSMLQFAIKKIARLHPVLLFSIIISVTFFYHGSEAAVFNSLFLQCIGISTEYKGINWYISPLFWVTMFYFALLKVIDNKKANLLIGVFTYFSYVLLINNTFGRETIYGFLNLGLLRALAGIGLGYLIGLTMCEMKRLSYNAGKLFLFARFFISSMIEFLSFFYLIKWFLCGKSYSNSFIVVLVFSILFICFLKKDGFLSRILDRKIFSILGRYAYSIYVMQQISFYVLQKSIWQTAIVNNVGMCIIISVCFSISVGIITYHFVEQPCSKLYLKLKFE